MKEFQQDLIVRRSHHKIIYLLFYQQRPCITFQAVKRSDCVAWKGHIMFSFNQSSKIDDYTSFPCSPHNALSTLYFNILFCSFRPDLLLSSYRHKATILVFVRWARVIPAATATALTIPPDALTSDHRAETEQRHHSERRKAPCVRRTHVRTRKPTMSWNWSKERSSCRER